MHLYFLVAPYDVTIEGDTYYFTGDTLELNCSSSGSPELQYRWYRNTSSIQTIFPANTTSDSKILIISNVTVNNEGVYSCIVSNEQGNSSYDILITIVGKNQLHCCSI